MCSQPLVTMIIPVYNVERYLDKCITSVVGQTYQKLDIVLVDDGSTDNSGEICNKWQQADTRIRVVHKKNGGLSDARNQGIETAEGEFLYFLDSDDYLEEDAIESLYELQREHSAEIVIGTIQKVDENYRKIIEDLGVDFALGRWSELKEIIFNRICAWEACGKLYRAELFREIRFQKGILYEDLHVFPRLLVESKKTVFCNNLKYNYLQRSDSIMGETRITISKDMVWIAEDNDRYFASIENEEDAREFFFVFYMNHILSNYLRIQNPETNIEFMGRCKEFLYKNFWRILKSGQIGMKRKLRVILVCGKMLGKKYD